MTTLSEKADSFSGHACGNPLRYVPKAEPPPKFQDIQSGVQVPVGGVAAFAAMYPVRELLLDLRQRTARAASLRRVPRINRYYPRLKRGNVSLEAWRNLVLFAEGGDMAVGAKSNTVGNFVEQVGVRSLRSYVVRAKTAWRNTGRATLNALIAVSLEDPLTPVFPCGSIAYSTPLIPQEPMPFIRRDALPPRTHKTGHFASRPKVVGGTMKSGHVREELSRFAHGSSFDALPPQSLDDRPGLNSKPTRHRQRGFAAKVFIDVLFGYYEDVMRASGFGFTRAAGSPVGITLEFPRLAARVTDGKEQPVFGARYNTGASYSHNLTSPLRLPLPESKVVQTAMRFKERIQRFGLSAGNKKPILIGLSHHSIIPERGIRGFHRQLKQAVATP